MNANKRQSMKSLQNAEKGPHPKSVAFTAQLTHAVTTPNVMLSPSSHAVGPSSLEYDSLA